MKELLISDKYHISCRLIEVGQDLCVILSGGDVPHIGAVSAGIYGPGIGAAHMTREEEERLSETVHTYAYPSHRDGFMSEPLAENLAKRLGRNVAVLCGIHVDGLPKDEIAQIVALLPEIEEKICGEYDKLLLDTL